MSRSSYKVTSHRWEIDNFQSKYLANYPRNEQMFGSNFNLAVQSSVSFALIYKATSSLSSSTFGVILKEFDSKKPLEVDVKIWLENDDGQKFYENSVQKQVFGKVGDDYKIQTVSSNSNYNLFSAVYGSRKTLFVCCEIIELNLPTPVVNACISALESLQEFHQNQWSAYENEMHDFIVKVGDTEFKIIKGFFMVQSDVFAQMFSSKFKEGITGEVTVGDVSEDTMQHLIKWLYTGQMEDEGKAEELFKAAEKYNIKLLKKTCTEILLSTLNKDNAFARFILGVVHNSGQLKKASLEIIAEMSGAEMAKFAMSTEWMEFSRKNASVADEVCKLVRQKFSTEGS